jgi:SAM-dependent methyltransferase
MKGAFMDEHLRDEARYELRHPRPSVVAAIAALELRPGMRLIDIGCGPGAHLGLFVEDVAPGGAVVGLDSDAERLVIAAELHPELAAARSVRLEEGDLHDLPFEDDAFDVAWMSSVLHHEEQPLDALAEMARVTRPGGLVAVLDGDTGGSFPCLPWPPAFELRLRAADLRAQEDSYGGTLPYHFSGFTGRALPRLLREAGLVDVKLDAFTEVDRAPLDPPRERELCNWYLNSFGRRIHDYLAPRDWEQLRAYVTPESDSYLLSDPDFFQARVMFLGLGRSTPPR